MEHSKRPNEHSVLRRIRSFVRREGRLTPGQEQAIESGWPKFGLNSQSAVNLTKAFDNNKPITLEIGFGDGESLADTARENPERNYIGIEVHRPGMGHLLRRVQDEGLTNIRVFDTDAIEVLEKAIPDHSLNCVQLFFPDPWHKKRHHKRRIVQTNFLNLIHRKLESDGAFHAATDWQHYAEHMLVTLSAHSGFVNKVKGYITRPKHRPITKFERRGIRLGHGVWDILFYTK
ncbi:MAG: tRNA (guanosine(46)-N7)-methyltransferase TrmB [Cycloclasticus sp. symbiont of Poecilosclerida sp. M]|nr:MAG: tRNA (guanosine(46)-N7)-methyltransferase TrmB [Cycloclasticus sp. symbiont of Poecilosclerida sp. M]